MTKITSGLEDYIEIISNYLAKYGKIRAIDIANELNVSRASVSEALKRLADQNLINYGRYGSIEITEKGKIAADNVIKRHNTLYRFLHNYLNLDTKEASENACKIEHVITDKFMENLEKFMSNYSEN